MFLRILLWRVFVKELNSVIIMKRKYTYLVTYVDYYEVGEFVYKIDREPLRLIKRWMKRNHQSGDTEDSRSLYFHLINEHGVIINKTTYNTN